jgi:hypothetical protein
VNSWSVTERLVLTAFRSASLRQRQFQTFKIRVERGALSGLNQALGLSLCKIKSATIVNRSQDFCNWSHYSRIWVQKAQAQMWILANVLTSRFIGSPLTILRDTAVVTLGVLLDSLGMCYTVVG